MDYSYIKKFDLDVSEVDFAQLSETLPERIDSFKEKLRHDGRHNISVHSFFYEGFQQWHGLLVQGEELFLGRIDWDFNGQSRKPRLMCGENEYRYFNLSTKDGHRRIKQFRHWFTFYQKYIDIQRCGGAQSMR